LSDRFVRRLFGFRGRLYHVCSPHSQFGSAQKLFPGADFAAYARTATAAWFFGNRIAVLRRVGWQARRRRWSASATSADQSTWQSNSTGGTWVYSGTATLSSNSSLHTSDSLGGNGNWVTTSRTQNYGDSTLSASSFSGSANYDDFTNSYYGVWPQETGGGTVQDTTSTLTSQSFNIAVSYGGDGNPIYSGSGMGKQASADTLGYNAAGLNQDTLGDSYQYSVSGGITSSSNIATDWTYDPGPGTWRAVQTQETDSGGNTYTNESTDRSSGPDDGEAHGNGSYSYTDNFLIQTDPQGDTTISGSDSGSGQALAEASASYPVASGDDATDTVTGTFTSGGTQTYSNNGPTGAWTGEETFTGLDYLAGSLTWSGSESYATTDPGGNPWCTVDDGEGYTGPRTESNSYPWPTLGETQPSPSGQGSPPHVGPQPVASTAIAPPTSSGIGSVLSNGAAAVGNVLGAIWKYVAPHPINEFNATVDQGKILFGSNVDGLDRAGAFFGVVGHGIFTVVSVIPVVNVIEGGVARIAASVITTGAEDLAENAAANVAETTAARTVSLTNRIIQNACFVAGTQVIVAMFESDGDLEEPDQPLAFSRAAMAVATQAVCYVTQNIEDVKPGELVVTRDQFDPEAPIALRRVEETFERIAHALTIVTIRSSTGTLQTLHSTSEHPVYVPERGWVVCRELKEGDQLVEPSGGVSTVISARYELHRTGVPVYNFTVAESHTYFVREKGSMAEPVWVHNANCATAAGAAADDLETQAVRIAEKQASSGNGFAVIGKFRGLAAGYIGTARTLGAAYFNLPADVATKLSEDAVMAANVAFIQTAIKKGLTFILTTAPEQAGRGLEMEIKLLLAAGYRYAETGLGITLHPA